jgi:hypothetical protein
MPGTIPELRNAVLHVVFKGAEIDGNIATQIEEIDGLNQLTDILGESNNPLAGEMQAALQQARGSLEEASRALQAFSEKGQEYVAQL